MRFSSAFVDSSSEMVVLEPSSWRVSRSTLVWMEEEAALAEVFSFVRRLTSAFEDR